MRFLHPPRVPASTLAHLLGWLGFALIFFLQSPGLVAADTKLDLVLNPAKFLHGALFAYTDTFTLGQLQNQAYGYLFPQGLFFLLADPLPDWVAQRLWWTQCVGVGYSGFLLLLQRARVGRELGFQILAALLYALSPRTLTTLGAISSETWPSMVAPWILLPLVGAHARYGGRDRLPQLGYSVVAVACLGAVNATATLAACVPAGLYLLYRRRLRDLALWLAGCGLVSAWWIVPLAVLGTYASPFTDYIESAGVTTKWLNLAEILRGTTSWTPFVEAERIAGNELVGNPYLVIVTVLVAGMGLVGLARFGTRDAREGGAGRGYLLVLLATGIVMMGGAHLATGFLDGAGQALRNVHKFDLLVRGPIAAGVACLGTAFAATGPKQASTAIAAPTKRKTLAAACALLTLGALAPAVNRVVPMGAYQQVPDYWFEAADYLNDNAADTRTLVLPASSFARQEWGWTRDELVQPLLDVPWAVRDSIPLVTPEAIRGLDGLTTHPTVANLVRHGIGALLIRHDLAGTDYSTDTILDALKDSSPQPDQFAPSVRSFGAVEVVLLDPGRSMLLSQTADVPTVAGGGEILSLLGEGTFQLVEGDADIVTDTPALVARNYGSLGSVSAPLASLDEATDVLNPRKDYASVGPLSVVTGQGTIRASSSQSDATAFGGSDPRRSITAAVDGDDTTAWYPAPGAQAGQWLEVQADTGHDDGQAASASKRTITITTVGDVVELTISSGSAHVSTTLRPRTPTEVTVPGDGSQPVRITLGASRYRTGIAEVSLASGQLSRILTVPDSSPNVQQFLFQRILSGESQIDRQFSAPRDMTVRVDAAECFNEVLIDDVAYRCGDSVNLAAGTHTLHTLSSVVTLTVPGFNGAGAPTTTLTFNEDHTVSVSKPSDQDRILVTTRAENSGLEGFVDRADGTSLRLESITVNAGSQGFIIPAGTAGTFRMHFAGTTAYRLGLGIGALLALVTVACLLGIGLQKARKMHQASEAVADHKEKLPGTWATLFSEYAPWALMIAGTTLTIGWPALAVAATVWLVLRLTLIPREVLVAVTMTMAAMWLARAPWPEANYAGDNLLLGLACAASLLSASAPHTTHNPRPGTN